MTDRRICIHCEGRIAIHDPKAVCKHLYYPEFCVVCQRIEKALKLAREEGYEDGFRTAIDRSVNVAREWWRTRRGNPEELFDNIRALLPEERKDK